jgi:hypothetical protein
LPFGTEKISDDAEMAGIKVTSAIKALSVSEFFVARWGTSITPVVKTQNWEFYI